jgi:predicted house-cleaning noncanonical NTP pyrophosphatase (MazG superfamily)
MNLTREHIIFTLGIELPLNESLDTLSEDLKKRIIFEQMIYESFIDSIKKYASEKWNKVVTTITDWKDAAVILGKVITNPSSITGFSDQLWKNFKSNILPKLINLLKKLKLDSYISQIIEVVDKITKLTGWQKFLAGASIASITQYIVTKLSNLSPEGLVKWIKSYFSDNIISTITSKLTDFSTYVGWLQPIIKGTEILFDILKPTIDKFKTAFNLKLNPIPQTENNMKKELLEKIIKEEIQNILNQKLNEETIQSPEVGKLITYLQGSGKTALNQVNNRKELNDILTAIFNGMNDTMKKDATVIAIGKLKDTRLK